MQTLEDAHPHYTRRVRIATDADLLRWHRPEDPTLDAVCQRLIAREIERRGLPMGRMH